MLTIAVDLDETLLYVTKEPLSKPARYICNYGHIYLRPHAVDFLRAISALNRVGIWSSAPYEYVTTVLRESGLGAIDFKFIWTAQECSFADYRTGAIYYYKDTNHLREAFNTDQVLLIDDSLVKIVNYGSDAIAVEPFTGNENDSEFLRVKDFVRVLETAERKPIFDKFGWRSFSGLS